MTTEMTIQRLAAMTLHVLKMQAEYFASRSAVQLSVCKDGERRLRETCEEILNPTAAGLFDGEAP